MKKQFTILSLSLLAAMGYAQDKNFNLSKYKFPDYKRHELEFNFNSVGSSSNHTFTYPIDDINTTQKYKSSKFQSNFDTEYKYSNFTRKRIDQLNISFFGSYNYYKTENYNSKSKEISPNLNLEIEASRKNYLKKDKLFIGEVLTFSSSYSRDKYTENTTLSDSKSYNTKLGLGISIGSGRIEHVSDLWQGYYILTKLKQQNSLDRELKEQDIFEFSKFISQLHNKRFFDYRQRKITEFQALDSMLYSQKLIDRTDMRYFTTLNDYWSYPSYFDRKSGKEIVFQLLPNTDIYRDEYTGGSVYTPRKTSLKSDISFEHNKQINLFWERRFFIGAECQTLIEKNSYINSNYPTNLFSSFISISYGFYPNTRTNISASLSYRGYEFETSLNKAWNNYPSANLGFTYFISPQLQFTGSFFSNYSTSKHYSHHGYDFSYNLGLRYAIF